MKVRTIKRFNDLKDKKVREIGDEFEVTQKRLEEILKVGKLVEVVQENPDGNSGGVELEELKQNELLSFIEMNWNGVEAPTKNKSEKVADYEDRLRNFIFENLEDLESGD